MTKRMETFLPALVVCGVLAATGIFHAWQRVESIRLSYRLGEVTSEHRALLGNNEHLRLEVATLKAPSRIERLARDELGMAPPRPSQVIVVRQRPAGQGIGGELAEASNRERAIAARGGNGEEPRG